MDTITHYSTLLSTILLRHADEESPNLAVTTEIVIDPARQRYLLMNVGWQGERRVHGCVAHIEIRDGKFWIQKDGTEYGIGNELIDAGVPKDHIVPAFYHESHRANMEYAIN